MTDLTLSETVAQGFMIGSNNAVWWPMPLIGVGNGAGVVGKWTLNTGTLENIDTTDIDGYYQLPLPTSKNTLKLYVDDIRIGLEDADASDYITGTVLYGFTYNTFTAVGTDLTNLTTAALHTWSRSPSDMSAYNAVVVRLDCVNGSAADMNITFVEASCYYDYT